MTQQEQIEQAVRNVMDACKGTLKINLSNLVREGFIRLPVDELTVISNMINGSIDEAYSKGRDTLMRTIDAVVLTSKTSKKA